jgi:eukaryotic translation initiation factor 2C
MVVYDGIGLGADEIQKNTNFASYMYARATRSVSLVPLAYYADLACERGRCYLHEFLAAGTQRSARSVSDEEKRGVYESGEKYWGNGVSSFCFLPQLGRPDFATCKIQ